MKNDYEELVDEVTEETAVATVEDTEEVKVTMKEKAINAGKKVWNFGKKVIVPAAALGLGFIGGVLLSKNNSDSDEDYEDNYDDSENTEE